MIKNTKYYKELFIKKRLTCTLSDCDKPRGYGYKYCYMHQSRLKKSGVFRIIPNEEKYSHLPRLLITKGIRPRTGKILSCLVCKNDYYSKPHHSKTQKYCSRICQFESQKTNKPIPCKICNKDFYVAKSTMKHRPRRTCSDKCYRILLGKLHKGSKSSFWRGGVSSKRRKIRYSIKIQNWREKIFKRDNFTCQKCGDRSRSDYSVTLNAHHIKPFSKYPKQRTIIKNGVTLCIDCHKMVHKNENKN